jgi:hypothetical protein
MDSRRLGRSICRARHLPAGHDGQFVSLDGSRAHSGGALRFEIEGGGIAVVGHGAPFEGPPPTAWRVAINYVVRKYLGDRSLPWDPDPPPPPEERHEAYLARSRFKDVTSYHESFDIEWTIDSMIGNLYSTSFCSRRLLGGRAAAFERDLRSAILAVEPSGILRGEPPEFFAYMARKC